METKRLTKLALLTTVALIIFAVESYIPVPVPIPGIKLGLANIITVYAAFTMTAADAVLILVCRIVLGSLFTGTAVSMIYSLGGGALCIAVTLLLSKILSDKQIWIASVCGAICHNIGQLAVASVVMGTLAVFAYLPALMISAVVTGAFTGFAAQALAARLKI